MNKQDTLKNIAAAANLRNRSIEPNLVVFVDGRFIMKQEGTDKPIDEITAFDPPSSINRCDCGNLLNITDRGYRCRQCVLSERVANTAPDPHFCQEHMEFHPH